MFLTFCLLYPPATERSWKYPFQGNAASGLWEHIETYYDPSDHRIYAHYAAIVQSSGMGKSRTVDELAKDHFVIPLNLREATSTGVWSRLGCLRYWIPKQSFAQDIRLQITVSEIIWPLPVQKMSPTTVLALSSRHYSSVQPLHFALSRCRLITLDSPENSDLV